MYNFKTYNDFIKYLYSYQDKKYKEFNDKLFNEDINSIGIRMNNLKNIARNLDKDTISLFKFQYYEEKMLYGLYIGYLKMPFKDILKEIDKFIIHNDNWAINDSTCSNLKIFKSNLEEGFIFINNYLKSNEPFKIRLSLVLLLDYYINEEYIDKILNICDNIRNDNYYVKMANAWLISMCYIKYQKKTYEFLLNNKLDTFTINKAISKIKDSYRVPKEEKIMLNLLKRK